MLNLLKTVFMNPKVLGFLGKAAVPLTVAGVAGGTMVAGDVAKNKGDGGVGDVLQAVTQVPGEAGARAGAWIGAEGLWAMWQQFGRALSGISTAFGLNADMGLGIQNFALGMMQQPLLTQDVFGRPVAGAAAENAANGDNPDANNPDAPKLEMAEDGVTPITAKNEITLGNIANDLSKPSWEGTGHTLHVAADATIGVGIDLVGLVPQAVDGIDKSFDGLLGIFGGDTGAEKRDLSLDFKKAADGLVHQFIPRAELTSAWDRAVHNGVNFGSYFIPFAGPAKFAGDISQGAENIVTTGNAFKELAPGTGSP